MLIFTVDFDPDAMAVKMLARLRRNLATRGSGMRAVRRLRIGGCGVVSGAEGVGADRDAEVQADQSRLMGTPCRFAEKGTTSVPV